MTETNQNLRVLHTDDALLVVDKPSGLLSVPTPGASGPTLLDLLSEAGQDARPVHRLDRDVSGALLCARDEATAAALEDLFRQRALRKTYWALVQGRPQRMEGVFTDAILDQGSFARVSSRGKPARTEWRTVQRYPSTTELEVDLITGRKNQIRLHFAHYGHPLVGERKYARGRDDPLKSKRVALHALRLEFEHPASGERLVVEAPLPAELKGLRSRARSTR